MTTTFPKFVMPRTQDLQLAASLSREWKQWIEGKDSYRMTCFFLYRMMSWCSHLCVDGKEFKTTHS